MTMHIRPLTVDDLPRCYEYGRLFHAERHVTGTFSEEVFLKNWTLFLQSPIAVLFGLWRDDELVGGIGGICVADLTSGDMAANELFWYVHPSARGGSWPLRLVARFREWGKELGAVRLRMVHMLVEGDDPMAGKLPKFYERLGLRACDVAFDGPI